jgi:hypothetical protein
MDYMSESASSESEVILSSDSEESNETYVTDGSKATAGLECCFSKEDYDHTLDSLSHEAFYVLDYALLNNCFMPWIKGWIP